jgi:hypothetical protein
VVIRDQEATAMSGDAHLADDITYPERDAPVPRSERTAPMITIGHLTRRYRTIAAVDGLSIERRRWHHPPSPP